MESGSLELSKWLFANGCNIPPRTDSSGDNCSIETFEWLKEKGLSIAKSPYLFIGAARKGNLGLLKNKCPLDFYTFAAAAEHGSLHILKWLLENQCPIDHWEIFLTAARHGNLENMNWLLENECPINDSRIFIGAAAFGSIDVMEWLLEHKCPIYDRQLQ